LRKRTISLRRRRDLTGRIFGRLKVIEETGPNEYGSIIWLVECKCGNRLNVVGSQLTQGKTRSCGCLSRELTSLRKRKDLTGRIFGRLKVIEEAERTDKGSVLWLVECQCDKRTRFVIKTSSLLSGRPVKSCGCLVMENKMVAAKKTAKKRIKIKDCFEEFIHLVKPNEWVEHLEK
jgi:hypothetical protein